MGLFVEILRERFTAGNGPDKWQWSADPKDTGILIESGFSDGNTVRGHRPGLFVDKDESIYGKNIIGDRVAVVWKNMEDYQWTLSTVPIIIECVASRKGESAALGDIVQWTLHCASDPIQAAYSLHDMTPPTLGRTVPYEGDTEAWMSPVSFTVQYPVRWSITPIRALLQQINMRIADKDATGHYVDIALYSTGLGDDE